MLSDLLFQSAAIGMSSSPVDILCTHRTLANSSLERINQYVTIEQEPEPKDGGYPPAYWPSSGELRAENLSASYSPGGPKVLENVSFHIQAGNRIGVGMYNFLDVLLISMPMSTVGRTGAGKSSLTLALLRCICTEGSLYYDGLLADNINLDAWRSNITIIPQAVRPICVLLVARFDKFCSLNF